jgi:hypothetical protein
MKTIERLTFRNDKIIKSEELIKLKGGTEPVGDACCYCKRWDGSDLGVMGLVTISECNSTCFDTYQTGYGIWNCLV